MGVDRAAGVSGCANREERAGRGFQPDVKLYQLRRLRARDPPAPATTCGATISTQQVRPPKPPGCGRWPERRIPMPREAQLARTLVELADTLVDDFDVVELLTLLADRCVEVLNVSAAGLMLVAPEGDLRVVASSSEEMRLVELFELQSQEGPCPDCYRTGEATLSRNLAKEEDRWPQFGPVALKAGFQSVHALPMRLRGVTIGALNLFQAEEGELDEADVVAEIGRAHV